MKKFYAFAAAAAMAITMSAQAPLYITGAGDDVNNWNPGAPAEFTFENNVYTFTGHLTEFKISSAAGTWDDFNAGAIGVDPAPEDLGTFNLAPNSNNTAVPWEGDYTLTVAADLSTITFATETPKPAPTALKVYVRGDMNGWLDGATDADYALWEMSTTATETAVGTTYWFDCQGQTAIQAGMTFKLATANWTGVNATTGGVVEDFNEAMEAGYNIEANMSFEEDYTGTIKLVLVNGKNAVSEITFFDKIVDHTAGIADITVDENLPAEYFNLQGVRVANPENGLFIKRQGNTVTKVIVK